MKDFLKRDLEIGDSVIIMEPGYRNFVIGQIVLFTPKNVRIRYVRNSIYTEDIVVEPHRIIKLIGPDLTMYLLSKK
jgi:hypothetical protein